MNHEIQKMQESCDDDDGFNFNNIIIIINCVYFNRAEIWK